MSYLRPPAPLSSSETDFRYLNYGKVKPSPLQPKIQKSSSEPELVHPDLFRDKLFLPAHPHQGLPLSITPQPLRKATKHIRSKSNTSDIKASEIPQETMEIVNLEKKRQSPILSRFPNNR